MGNCMSLQFSCDGQTVNPIFRWLRGKGYNRNLKENFEALKEEMENLKAIQHEVQNKVAIEVERGRLQKREVVKVWLERVQKTDREFSDLLSTRGKGEKLCLCGLCSKSFCSSYKQGEKVFLLLEDVKKLISEGSFTEVTEQTPGTGVEEMLTWPTIGQEMMLEKAWNRIMEDEVGIMGLHGMSGVGKTTLFKKIHNKFTEMAGQLRVIWVGLSKGMVISKLQQDIAKQLQLCDEAWMNKNESEKATDIFRILKGTRFVLLLDDIWEEVDLEAIGVPAPTRDNKCKVAFTTRFQEVCRKMGDKEPLQVECLKQEEACELFENMAGVEKLRSDPVIVMLAKNVVEKCGGLPLALIIIGKTMASRTTVQEWKLALNVLSRSAAEFSDFEDKILSILKYSYDCLRDEQIKSCFLYCALFPEDYEIYKEMLIEYWICEGLTRESQDIKRATNERYEILGTLIRANLLMEALSTSYVGMHDMVREMALWIASDFGKQKKNFLVQAGVGLGEVPELKDWGSVKRMSLMKNKIGEITCSSKCSELTTLFLQNNNLKNISGEFIRSMQKLVVLDLSGNRYFSELPEQISELVSLQYLNLQCTSIKQLPVGFQKMKKLIHLNLWHTYRLCSLTGISKLSSLRILELQDSNVHGDITLLKELQHLEHLQILNMTISTELFLDQILHDQKLAKYINGLHILGFQQEPFNISMLVGMENLKYLKLENSQVSDIITDMESKESTSPCFSNLTYVEIKQCSSIKDTTWLLFAPNLVILKIEDSEEVEEVINKEKDTNLTGLTTPFQKLEVLLLTNLPKLETIYWSPLPFPVLLNLIAKDCPKLRTFHLNASSAPRVVICQIVLSSPREEFPRFKVEDLKFSNPKLDEDSKKLYVHARNSIPDIEWEDEDIQNIVSGL